MAQLHLQLVQNRLQQVRQQPDHERVRFLDVTQQVAPLHPALGVRIGRGSFGNVYAAEWTCPQPPDHTHPAIRVVVKVLDGTATNRFIKSINDEPDRLKWSTEDVKKAFILEAKSWVKVTPHENVLSLIGFTFSPSAGLRLVMPRIDQPKLQDGLDAENTNSTLTYQRRCALILDVANGLAHLHSLAVGLVHGDLHPGNIFMHQGRAIIADFGLAKPVVNTERVALHKFPGHILYSIVPELIRDDNTPRTMEVDIYMFGCIAKIIFTRRNGALHAQNDNITLNQVNVGDPRELVYLKNNCCAAAPGARPTALQIIQHSLHTVILRFFEGILSLCFSHHGMFIMTALKIINWTTERDLWLSLAIFGTGHKGAVLYQDLLELRCRYRHYQFERLVNGVTRVSAGTFEAQTHLDAQT
ncbi:kinase-like domain-containing protein [Rhodocollybia butyracea]|uniref:Kinase-like domain-containing protein n=1 Tax=Rhodocollybia butyracea TaxID=206335 RepID=A0A9P5P7F2_9AGAR|nr:kinase-like domain-containing protein [Rhodocollybia butyracea]